jgi:hypothetical protein
MDSIVRGGTNTAANYKPNFELRLLPEKPFLELRPTTGFVLAVG